MAAWDFNLQIPYQAPALLAQGLAGLGQGVSEAIQRRQQAAAEAEQLQYEAVKNQTIVKNLFDQKMVTPEQYLEFQSAAPKKQKSIAEGLAANVHFNMMLDKERRAQAPLNVQPVAVPGGTPLNVLQGGGMAPRPLPQPVTPAAPSMGTVIDPQTGQPRPTFNPGGSPLAGSTLLPGAEPPIDVKQFNRPGGGTVEVIGGGGMKPTVLKKEESDKPSLYSQLTPEIIAEGKKHGVVPFPQTTGSIYWVKAAEFGKENPAVKVFDDTIGKTYGVKSADIFKINLTEPKAIKYVNPNGPGGKDVEISTEDAIALGPQALAVIPIDDPLTTTKARRIPLPEWNTILNQWRQLPRAGSISTDPARANAPNAGGPAGGRTLSPQEQRMLDWALANPGTTADQIKARLGIK